MNKSVIIIMSGALVVAIIVAMIVQARLAPKPDVNETPMVEILVAAKPIAIGTKLEAPLTRWQPWPETAVYSGLIKKSEQADPQSLDVYGTPLRRSVEAGEPVTRQALIDIKGSTNFLAASINPGMRAIGISVKAETAAGGFIGPGDFVDVVLAYTPDLRGDSSEYAGDIVQRYASQTILSNVKVLAVDQQATTENREAKVAKTVTLEVSREGAEVIALGRQMGDISLVLRRIGEVDTPRSAVHPIVTDMTMSEVLQRVNTTRKKAKTQSNIIRVYNGNAVQNMPVRTTPDSAGKAAGR